MGSTPLGAYTVDITYNQNVTTIASIAGGTAPQFSDAPIANPATFTSGTSRISAFNIASLVSPTGIVNVARVTFNAVGSAGTSSDLGLNIVVVADPDGHPIPVTAVGCRVTLAANTGGNCPTPIPTATSTATPTATASPTPSNAELLGSVTLQGRPAPPNARWSVPLQVSLTPQGGGAALSCAPTTDSSGNFSCSFLPGAYTACVKNSQTLQNCRSVTLGAGPNPVNFCTLREGDANNNNCVQVVDFSILASTFSKCTGDAGFDARADFDGNGCVQLVDFSLLATNFGQCGPLVCTPPAVPLLARRAAVADGKVGGAVSPIALAMEAPSRTRVGEVFDVQLAVEAGHQLVDGAAAYVRFDPRLLQVEEVTAGGAFDLELRRQVDNTAGTVDYAAGTLGAQPSGSFGLATLRVRALRAGRATLALSRSMPRLSDVTWGGASVLGGQQAATVVVVSQSHRRPWRPGGPHTPFM